jgi:hypothetical protein
MNRRREAVLAFGALGLIVAVGVVSPWLGPRTPVVLSVPIALAAIAYAFSRDRSRRSEEDRQRHDAPPGEDE